MGGKLKEPTEDEMRVIGDAAINAAIKKTEELGYSWLFAIPTLACVGDGCGRFMSIVELMGADAVIELGKALLTARLHDTINEAEEILREGE